MISYPFVGFFQRNL